MALPFIPRWILDLRVEVEKLARICELSSLADPDEFEAREKRIRAELLSHARSIVRRLEYVNGIHRPVATDSVVTTFARRRRMREIMRALKTDNDKPPPRAA